MGTAETQRTALHTESLTGLHWIGVVATLVTAAVHLFLGVRMLPSAMGGSFVLAGLGFLGGIGLLLLDYRRRTVYAVGVVYTLVQILLWYWVNFAAGSKSFPADVGTLGAVDKVAQVVLVAILVVLLR
ncbi:DUF7475 family protein [Natrinema longum]|uniref:Uncharacterized protein n=1 Tax=Natrinema longum TaxID=370324 RepID=A0A8A2UDH3_9EURY|nr:hypothetical protein [Natrinema longum]MBZ6496136.1 hypothetical protein [Natrinema longum]QSW85938.1 hypothetical protein J0X27_03640 [Natrinema longum]